VLSAIGLTGNRNTYIIGSIASVICFSNFTVASIRWLTTSDNVTFTTEEIKNNELYLILNDPISHTTHGAMFTCEVTSILPHGRIGTSTTLFTIRTFEESKLEKCMYIDNDIIKIRDTNITYQ